VKRKTMCKAVSLLWVATARVNRQAERQRLKRLREAARLPGSQKGRAEALKENDVIEGAPPKVNENNRHSTITSIPGCCALCKVTALAFSFVLPSRAGETKSERLGHKQSNKEVVPFFRGIPPCSSQRVIRVIRVILVIRVRVIRFTWVIRVEEFGLLG
jgi:hypothetical protein